jgi:hypothetical protein
VMMPRFDDGWLGRVSCGAVVCIAHDGEPGEFGRGA